MNEPRIRKPDIHTPSADTPEESDTSAGAPRPPLTTYRLQFNKDFRLRDAAAIVDYLSDLGVTDIYASPFLEATRGSLHGYDVTNHASVNPEIGTEEDLKALSDALRARGMGLILDIVPNHMGIAQESNRWWQDVLENGRGATHAHCFDIDWTPRGEERDGRVLLPCLGDPYEEVLERGEIRISRDGASFHATCWERRFPISPLTWQHILHPALEKTRSRIDRDTGSEDPDLLELGRIVDTLDRLALSPAPPGKAEVVRDEREHIRRRLATLLESSAHVRDSVDESVDELNGKPGEPGSFQALDALLNDQHYRLCHWRLASEEINYRRFFDINELAAIRIEDPEVFEAAHATVLRWIREGIVTGLRIDHPDGLLDPLEYLLRLQTRCLQAFSDQGAPGEPRGRRWYVVVEKILSGPERLRRNWPVAGTTGYEFLRLLGGLFVDPRGEKPLRALYDRFTGQKWDLADLLYRSKKFMLESSFRAEVGALLCRLTRLAAAHLPSHHRPSGNLGRADLREGLTEVLVGFPVYRTYLTSTTDIVAEEDRDIIRTAVQTARRRSPHLDESLLRFIESLLLLEEPSGASPEDLATRKDFILRLQQLTGPAMAKGLEDTAFYRAYPLASLNEVGGELEEFGVSPREFHERNTERIELWPHAMSCTETHDTKRGEDVRTRISVLSEIPEEWEKAVSKWSRLNRELKTPVHGKEVPGPNEEYLIYQTLVGTWPLVMDDAEQARTFVQRIEQYVEKALKEAKTHTSWTDPDREHEEAVGKFIRRLLTPGRESRFVRSFRRFQDRVAFVGMLQSLSQVALKATSPGVPDFYQGTELWSLVLVDPDNRHPVDFAAHRKLLGQLRRREARVGSDVLLGELCRKWKDGRLKLYLSWKALSFRKAHADLFLSGSYLPLDATGPGADRLCAFARNRGTDWALVVAGRLLAGLLPASRSPLDPAVWGDTTLRLPPGAPSRWRSVLTGEQFTAAGSADSRHIHLREPFRDVTIALLEGEPDE